MASSQVRSSPSSDLGLDPHLLTTSHADGAQPVHPGGHNQDNGVVVGMILATPSSPQEVRALSDQVSANDFLCTS